MGKCGCAMRLFHLELLHLPNGCVPKAMCENHDTLLFIFFFLSEALMFQMFEATESHTNSPIFSESQVSAPPDRRAQSAIETSASSSNFLNRGSASPIDAHNQIVFF